MSSFPSQQTPSYAHSFKYLGLFRGALEVASTFKDEQLMQASVTNKKEEDELFYQNTYLIYIFKASVSAI